MSDGSKTDLKKVKELIGLMKENDLVEIEIVDGENKILLIFLGNVLFYPILEKIKGYCEQNYEQALEYG